ncbi:MAG: DVUA0089 family protein [Pyrinomonadaceae bacterium]
MITRIRKLGLALLTLVVLGLAAAPHARADTFTFNGTLTPGSPVQLFSLTVSNSSSVLIRGTANFDLALSLFDAAGDTLNIAIDEDGLGPPFVATLEDEFGNLFLMPGTYLLAVTPLPLLPGSNLSEGFFFATDQFGRELTFADFGFTGASFTLEISGPGVTQAAPVPEPATMLLLSTGLAGVVAGVRRRRLRNERTRAE